MWLAVFLSLVAATIIAVVVLTYRALYKHANYWKDRGVPEGKASGSLFKMLVSPSSSETIFSRMDGMYNEHKKHGYIGFFQFHNPTLIVTDPELVKLVLTKDFSTFHDRNPVGSEEDPLLMNLFNMTGLKWKYLRAKLSPTFTSGKMKHMFGLILEVEEELKGILRPKAKIEEEVELKDLILRYSTDVIATCAFGVACNTLKTPDSEFYKMSRKFFSRLRFFFIKIILEAMHKQLGKLVPSKMLLGDLNKFFIDLVNETVDYRKKNNVQRNDFVQLLLNLQNEDKTLINKGEDHVEITSELMTSQAVLFFIAGLDNTTNTLVFCLYELALNPDLQEKAAKEVRDSLKQHGGKWTYEALQQMELIERIVFEALRKYTPIGAISRIITAPSYTIPGTNCTLDKLPMLIIPTHQMHHDPDIFPDPERFDPDRFTEEAKQTRHPYAYLPFGEGPRVCIANRFAMMESKMCLAGLLEEFEFCVGSKTETKVELDKFSFGPSPKNGMWLKIKERK